MSNKKQIKRHRTNRIGIDDLYERQTRKKTVVKKQPEFGFVYFIGNSEKNICKIGFSYSPNKRLKELQTGNPFPLFVFKTVKGDMQMEKTFHFLYRQYRTQGEWFKIEGELKKFIIS